MDDPEVLEVIERAQRELWDARTLVNVCGERIWAED